jgi:hypothetical protein
MARRITTGEVGGAGSSGLNITNTVLSAADDLDIVVEPKGTGIFIVAGDTTLEAQGDLRFADADSSNWVAFQAPATVSSNVTWTLPSADAASSGYGLVSNASGTLSWAQVGPVVSDQTVSAAVHYPMITTTTSGQAGTVNVSTTKLTFTPSTGIMSLNGITGYAAAVTLTQDESTNATYYPLFASAVTGNLSPRTDSGYTYNPSSGTLTAVILTASSDVRLKENIRPITGALELVQQLEGVLFNRIGQSVEEIGVIAQQVEKIVPQLVHTDDMGMKSVAYANAVALLIEAVKEQQLQIKELKGRLV